MKSFITIILTLVLVVSFSGCGYKLAVVKKDEVVEPASEATTGKTMTVTVGEERRMETILQEILLNGQVIDKDVYARNFGEYEYTWEIWVIQEGKDFHAAIIENGKLTDIAPVESLEQARAKFKPYGGWKHN